MIESSYASLCGAKEDGRIPSGRLVIADDFSADEGEWLRALGLGETLALVCDTATYEAYGRRIERALHGAGGLQRVLLAGTPVPDEKTVLALRRETHHCDGILAVGSGTINDLCKYVSYLDKKPYAVCATGLSMNGYVSANASIAVAGHKKTLAAHTPRGVLLDLGILAQAPLRLTQSGFGDSLCRSTAQADWLLSHLLLETAYDPAPFEWLAPYENALLAEARGIATGDKETLALLARTLMVSGLGMTVAGGSYPASQGEHLIAHTMEMKHGSALPQTYHGEQIGVTTLTMARLQEECLAGCPRLKVRADGKTIHDYFGAEAGAEVEAAYRRKLLSSEWAETMNARLAKDWPQIAARIQAVRLPPSLLQKALEDAGCATTPEALGWQPSCYDDAVRHAHLIRERFTFLDLER